MTHCIYFTNFQKTIDKYNAALYNTINPKRRKRKNNSPSGQKLGGILMNKNLVENKVEVIKQDYTLYGKEVLHACFIAGATYQVPAQNLISKGVEVQFTVLKNTHKSVTIEVVEKYNGTINTSKAVKRLNAGGVGFWKTIQGVEYATVETFNANKLTRWVKGYINPFSCELATKELTVDVQSVATAEPVEKLEKVLDFSPVFYEIDEKMARLAREMNSFREYEENSTTEHYKARVKEVFSIAEKNQSEKSLYLANIYAKKYAEYINNSNRVDCLCPSIMISGSGNFNIRKKEKQNARRENLMHDYEKLQNLLEKIERPEGWGYAEIKRDTITANEFDGVQFFKVVTNEEVNRLQLVDFEEIPTDEQKSILKHNGFKWSPRFQAWQRQLTENAISGVWRVVREFERLENEEIEELHATIKENKTVENAETVEKTELVAETPEPVQAQEVEPAEEIKLECVKSVVIDFKRNEEIQQVEPEPVQEVTEEQSKEDSEKIEPTPATEERPETSTKQEKHSKKSEPTLKNVIDKSKLMRRAWDIRKSLAEEMKVKVSIISMSESLKIAWAEAKSTANTTTNRTLLDVALDRLKKSGFTNITSKHVAKSIKISFQEEKHNVPYRVYKNDYSNYNTIKGSYNSTTKTIDLISDIETVTYEREILMQSVENMTEQEIKHALAHAGGCRERLNETALMGKMAIERPKAFERKKGLQDKNDELIAQLF